MRLLFKPTKTNNRGDTIVEVLIALAVISLVLGGAYVSANHSLNNSRQSEERGEALKIVQTQLERLKSLADQGKTNIFTTDNQFCLGPTSNLEGATSPIRSVATEIPLNQDNFSEYQDDCHSQGLGGLFNISIVRNNASQFTVYARWDKVGGQGHEELKITNRVYQQ